MNRRNCRAWHLERVPNIGTKLYKAVLFERDQQELPSRIAEAKRELILRA
jgi:hypothetical protein